jgi:hypothetical protein
MCLALVAAGLRAMQRSAAICNVMTRINTWIQAAYRTLDVDANAGVTVRRYPAPCRRTPPGYDHPLRCPSWVLRDVLESLRQPLERGSCLHRLCFDFATTISRVRHSLACSDTLTSTANRLGSDWISPRS